MADDGGTVSENWLIGGGEMGALIRTRFTYAGDHPNHVEPPLGPVATWPQNLKTALSILLNTSCPMFLVWGSDRLLFYNDAYSALLKVSNTLISPGQPLNSSWSKTWAELQADVNHVFSTQQPLQQAERIVNQHNGSSHARFNWSYNPLWDEVGQVTGVFATGCLISDSHDTQFSNSALAVGRSQTVAPLTNSEKSFQYMADYLPIMIWVTDPDGKGVWANQKWCEFTGQTLEESLCNGWLAAIHPEDAEYVQQINRQAYQTYELKQLEYRLRRHDGEYRWVFDSALPWFSDTNHFLGYVGSVVDITALKRIEDECQQAEAAFQESENRFRRIFDCNMIGMGIWNRSGGITHANDALLNLIGYSREELTAGLVNWYALTPPEQLYLDERSLAEIEATGVGSPYEKEYIHKTGRRVPILVGGASFTGTADSGVFFAIDLTDRKQAEGALRRSEERLRLALEGAQMGTWDVDLLTGKAFWSELHFAMLGYEPTPTGEASESMWIQRIHPDDRERVLQEWQRSRQEHRSYQAEYRVIRADNGQIAWLNVLGTFTYNANGQALRSIGVVFDITERKRIEEEHDQVEAALRESEALKQSILDSSSDCIKVVSLDGRILYINTGGMQTIEAEDEDSVVGCSWFSFWQAQESDLNAAIAAALAGNIGRFQGCCPTLKQKPKWWDVIITPLRNNCDQVVKLVVISRDITEQKQAEAELQESETRFRQMADTAPTLIWMSGIDKLCNYFNQPWLSFTGRTLEQEMGNGWTEGIHPDDFQCCLTTYTTAFDARQSFEMEYRLRRHDGEYRWILDSGVPRFTLDGEFLGFIGSCFDIHDRKQIEEMLQQREAELRLVTNAVPVLISFVDADQRYRFNNRGYEEWFGRPTLENYGKHLRDVLGDTAYEEIRPYVELVLTGQQVNFEGWLPYKHGGGRYVDVTYVPRFSNHGAVEGFVALVNDISDRKQSEIDLRRSEQRYRTLAEATSQIIWDTQDTEGQFTTKQPGWSWFTGQTFDEYKGWGWLDAVHPDDQATTKEVWSSALANQIPCEMEHRLRRHDGVYRYMNMRAVPVFEEDGTIREWIGVHTDASDRKQAETNLRQSEERYRCLAESIPQLVWTSTAAGMLLDVNQRWSMYTGLTLEQAKAGGWEAVVHPDDVPILSQNWLLAQQSGTDYHAEGRMLGADGVYRWHLHQAVPLKDEAGQIIKWFGTATDIEEQKQLEQQRDRVLQQEQAARAEAEKANRIKDEFLAVLSHELRSPLNPILGWSRLLQTGKLNATKSQQALATIERNAQLQAELIEDLLDVSRILQGKLSLAVSPVNLTATIQAAIDTVRLAADAKAIQIETQLDSTVGMVLGDSTRLQQVVWNLLSNGVKFTPTGGRVKVQLQHVELWGIAASRSSQVVDGSSQSLDSVVASSPHPVACTYAQITVSDTGKGIAPDFLPHVFDYFRQEDGATTRKFGGLGLGLAIVRHLVELHGGTIRVDSPGENLGATFTVQLPLMPTQQPTDCTHSVSELASDLQDVQILVIDDDNDTRELIVFLLEQAGATVTSAASAKAGLQTLMQSRFDVLISDIGMPEMDGYMLMRKVRSLPSELGGQIPAIALTAYAGEIDYQQALAAGFQRHIPKPIRPEALVHAIVQLLDLEK